MVGFPDGTFFGDESWEFFVEEIVDLKNVVVEEIIPHAAGCGNFSQLGDRAVLGDVGFDFSERLLGDGVSVRGYQRLD